MVVNLSWKQLVSTVRNVASIAAIVIGAVDLGSLPPGVRTALVVIGGIVQAIDHAIQAPAIPGTAANPTPVKQEVKV